MSVFIPVGVTCDAHGCKAEANGRLEITYITDKGEISGRIALPDGWIDEAKCDHYSSELFTECLCPVHGKEKHPWRY